jgi:hypothetical protein
MKQAKKTVNAVPKLRSEAELVEYEKYAVEGLIEFIRKGYDEVGLGGLLHSLYEVVQECDKRANEVHNDADPEMRASREAVADYLRLLAMMSRPEVAGAVEFLGKQEEKKLKVIGEA